ncbi:MAG: hypothetical protein AABY22_17685 [Nanoarchaeota archaeon]
MKFKIIDSDKPFLIDGTTKLEITFEVEDIFIDINNSVKVIKNIVKNQIQFIDEKNNISVESFPLNNDFITKYRYAGTIQDDMLPIYEDAIPLF